MASTPPVPPIMQPPPKKTGCTCVGCLLGCAGVTLVLMLVGGIAGWWVYKQLPGLARQAVDQAVNQSDLSDEDKKVVMAQVDRLVDGYQQGKVDLPKLGQFFEQLSKSPLMDLMIAYAAKVKYIDPSGLTPEEKAAADRTLQRVARGVIGKKISDDDLDAALDHISSESPGGGREFREKVSDEELRAFLGECQRLADEAQIPSDEFQVDIGGELKKLVDEALGESSPPPVVEAP
jgi:hypothetical protein